MIEKPKPKLPNVYFDLRRDNFLMELVPGRFVALSEPHIRTHLQIAGHEVESFTNNGINFFKNFMAQSQIKNMVEFSGPLAGYKAGIQTLSGGRKILVTHSVQPVQPDGSRKLRHMQKYLDQLLGPDTVHFIDWMSVAWKSLNRQDFRASQILFIVGKGGCGKTFLQWIISQMLGGRTADPYRYMMGETQFNTDLAMAEHLAMGDVAESYDIRTRRHFAAQIKQLCVEPDISVHGKGKDATLRMPTFRRVSMTVNDERDRLLVIPPRDADIIDKITILKCSHATLSPSIETNQSCFGKELPAFAWMLQNHKVPPERFDSRFGVRSYANEEIVNIISDSEPQTELLSIMDSVLWSNAGDDAPWIGSSEQLKVQLLASEYYFTISKLLSYTGACGNYLARLKQKFPARFEQRFSKGKSSWVIKKETDQ